MRRTQRKIPQLFDCPCRCVVQREYESCGKMSTHQHAPGPCERDTRENKIAFYRFYDLELPAGLAVGMTEEGEEDA